ncbi:MAG: SMC-Scp complex subunit ScpB [Methanomassiliicoccaceae archaeon]|nr:SMC-Scp complex subunit ScpB [Methanomassiliicoccaceae archaeon]
MDARGAVEAALFASAKGLRVIDIANQTGLTEEAVRVALKSLAIEYERMGSAITIAKIDAEYAFQLRSEYAHYAEKFSEIEIAKGVLRTAAAIAYNQPLLQSELFRTLGARVYDDVRKLMELDLITGRHKGQTLELTTTKKFAEYFGIEGTSKADIKKWIERVDKKGHNE